MRQKNLGTSNLTEHKKSFNWVDVKLFCIKFKMFDFVKTYFIMIIFLQSYVMQTQIKGKIIRLQYYLHTKQCLPPILWARIAIHTHLSVYVCMYVQLQYHVSSRVEISQLYNKYCIDKIFCIIIYSKLMCCDIFSMTFYLFGFVRGFYYSFFVLIIKNIATYLYIKALHV